MTLSFNKVFALTSSSFVRNLLDYWERSSIRFKQEAGLTKSLGSSSQEGHASYSLACFRLSWCRSFIKSCFVAALLFPSSVRADRACDYIPPDLTQMHEEGVAIDYYYLSSSTSAKLRDELRSNGPRNESGRRFDAFFSWYVAWKWPVRKTDKQTFPDYSKLSFQKTLRLQFPCWQPSQKTLPEDSVKQWRTFVNGLAKHEMKHYEIFKEGESKLTRVLREFTSRGKPPTPEEVNAEGQKILDQVRAADSEYDAATHHGKTEGITYELLSF